MKLPVAVLSGTSNGLQNKITATASTGDTIHTAHASALDEIWLWAVNSSATDRELTIQWGETGAPDGNIRYTVPSKDGLHLIVPGILLTNSLLVTGFVAAESDVIMVTGYVNRIT